jgi:hypothetical protein
MVGCAAESLLLSLRNRVVVAIEARGETAPKRLMDWKIKSISDAIKQYLETRDPPMPNELKEKVAANWAALAFQMRAVRNDAGHPVDVDPISPDQAHAALLIFPELAKMSDQLSGWISTK